MSITSFPIVTRSLYGPYYYDIRDYASGSQLTGGADATAAVQAALDDIQTAMLASHGGCYALDIQNSILRIDGALNTRNGGNSQLVLPALPVATAAQCSLTIYGGNRGPASGMFGTVINSVVAPTAGAIIKSTLTTGGGTQPSVISGRCSGGQFSILFLKLQGVNVQTVPNPLISGVDFSLLDGFEMVDSNVTTGIYSVDSLTVPTTSSSYGIIAPTVNNGTEVYFHNAGVIGFYTGACINEHAHGDLCVFGCVNALQASSGYHAIHLERFEDCANIHGIVSAGGIIRIKIDAWIIEHAAAGSNFVRVADVVDSGDYLVGSATWSVVLGDVGIDHTFTKTGGTNFLTTEYGTSAGGGIGGTTGSTDKALLRANGTGGSTVQGSPATLSDAGVLTAVEFDATNASAPAQIQLTSSSNNTNARLVFNTKDSSGTARAGGAYYQPGTSAAASYFAFSGDNASYHLKVFGNGAIAFPSYGAGTVTADASGNLTTSSDARLKVVGADFVRGLKDITKITPKVYRWTAKSGNETEHDYAGLIAQDVEAAIPEAVGMDPRGMRTLSDRALIAALINAVKELNAEVETLKARK